MAKPTIDGIPAKQFCNRIDQDPEEWKRISYIKRSLPKAAHKTKTRLILNHVITTFNVYGEDTPRILFAYCYNLWPQCKAILAALDMMPAEMLNINETELIKSDDVQIDQALYDVFRVELARTVRPK
jgi:hypothetical protein